MDTSGEETFAAVLPHGSASDTASSAGSPARSPRLTAASASPSPAAAARCSAVFIAASPARGGPRSPPAPSSSSPPASDIDPATERGGARPFAPCNTRNVRRRRGAGYPLPATPGTALTAAAGARAMDLAFADVAQALQHPRVLVCFALFLVACLFHAALESDRLPVLDRATARPQVGWSCGCRSTSSCWRSSPASPSPSGRRRGQASTSTKSWRR